MVLNGQEAEKNSEVWALDYLSNIFETPRNSIVFKWIEYQCGHQRHTRSKCGFHYEELEQ